MNSDKFDRVVLDLLYSELDELTTAAARRHLEQSGRAREIYAHLRATRTLAVLPCHRPPADFEASLLERVGRVLDELPLHRRVGRWISMLAGYAMRPQLVMGALLLLMIASSPIFVRAKPALENRVQVIERGVPEVEREVVMPLAAGRGARGATTGSAEPSSTPDALFERALEAYRAERLTDAQREFDELARSTHARAPEAALHSALITRRASGCAAAMSSLAAIRERFASTPAASEAAWLEAQCWTELGNTARARARYEALLDTPDYRERSAQALEGL